MPTSFEVTFTQPLLVQLDLGKINGSKAMARAITQAYTRTLLTGLPGGGTVPPVLPAPALGTPPPPFPLPSIPINNYQGRARAMQRILQTYFEVREFLPVKSDIRQTITQIRLLIQKGKRLKQDIKTNVARIKQIQREIANLPQLLSDIKTALSLLVKLEQQRVNRLFNGLSGFEARLGPVAYQAVFAQELQLINTIKNFKITLDPKVLQDLIGILDELEREVLRVPNFSEDDPESDMKRYIKLELASIVQRIVLIGNSVVSPEEYIDFYRDIAAADPNYEPVLATMNRYVELKRFLDPELKKLKEKQFELRERLRVQVQDKLKEQKDKLKEKKKKLATKKAGSGKRQSFVKAAKTIKDTKKKYLGKIKKIKAAIKDIQSVLRSVNIIKQRVASFKDSIETTYKTDLKTYLNEIKSLPRDQAIVERLGTDDIVQDIKAYLVEVGIKDPAIQKLLITEVTGKVPTPYYFIEFFERKTTEYVQPLTDITTIHNELGFIYDKITSLISGKPSQPRTVQSILPEEASLMDVLLFLLQKAELFFSKIQQKVSELTRKARQFIQETTEKLIEEAKKQLILLVPIKSDVVDVKNKIAVVKAKKDKIIQKKNTIRRRIKQVTTLTRAAKAFGGLARELSKGNIRYTSNSANINKLIDNLYEFKLLENPSNASSILKEKETIKSSVIDYYYGAELLIDLVIELIAALKKGDMLKALKNYINTLTDNLLISNYRSFYNQLTALKDTQPTPQKIIKFVSSLNFKLFESSHLQSALFDIENALFYDIKSKYELLSENPLVKRVMPIKPFEESIIAAAFQLLNNKIIQLKAFIDDKIYKKMIKPKQDAIKAKLKRIEEDVNKELKKMLQRQINLDAKLMTIAFNLATRAFWTGFSWMTPNGVRYLCISVGPFLPIKAKADAGASAMVRQIAKSLNLQLLQMTGTVIPPVFTGIPPFPFAGYR